MSIVICKLPKAGLGNQLFPLFKAMIFAKKNNLPLIIVGYHQINWRLLFTKVKTKRKYAGYFKFNKSLLGEGIDKLRVSYYEKRYSVIKEPKLNSEISGHNDVYEFSTISHWSDYFDELKENREDVILLMQSILKSSVIDLLNKQIPPIIGVHIRMGDFRKLKEGEDFRKVGGVRTPEDYFVDIVQKIREINGKDLPVTVFSDGYIHEFENLFSLGNIKLMEGNPDIVDLLLLSKSKIIITSAGSTFSYWAGFLSDTPMIMHPDHIHKSIRPDTVNSNFYEGYMDLYNPNGLFVTNIKGILHE